MNTARWADVVEEPEGDVPAIDELFIDEELKNSESEVDANGVKTVIEYKKDHKTAERIKVIKTVKVTTRVERVKKAVIDRRTWKKFGAAAEVRDKKHMHSTYSTEFQGVGFQMEGVTYKPEPVNLDFTPKAKVQKKVVVDDEKKPVGSVVVCRICGMTGDHWSMKCPNKEKIESGKMKPLEGATAQTTMGTSAAAPKNQSYVPPSMRDKDGGRRTDLENIKTFRPDDQHALRVSNLSDDTREEDLQALFKPFGPLSRVYLAKDRITGKSRGFAFVNFCIKEDAAMAMSKLAGYGYDHLILQIEWSKPAEN